MTTARRRRFVIAAGIYAVVVGTFFAVIPKNRILEHTPFNHFALLAESWLHGRLDLPDGPPPYAQNNDFASYGHKWFIAFPPFPAVLLLPFVWWGKTAERVRDAQVFVWLSGIGPAVFFLGLEKLRRMGENPHGERANIVLALLLAFGSVYFFTGVQGTVWFAAHVVAVALAAIYLLAALEAEHAVVAGLMIGLGFLTRPPLLYAAPLFVFEACRTSLRGDPPADAKGVARVRSFFGRLDKLRVVKKLVLFAVPLAMCLGFALWHNKVRFGKATDFGYQYLTVAWQARMKRWGLFSYHYLARNLGIVLTSLPFYEPNAKIPVQINDHGLALWLTTPLYLWLLWPKRSSPVVIALYVTALCVALPGLFYQNTGWMQFGYRFSNDYAVFLFALLAVIGIRYGKLFTAAAVWSVALNAFGAISFDTNRFRGFYFEDPSQRIIYQQD
ncbi:MAG TPA: hypothetical protein VHC69_02895 [Polyangiaceae bacterium]|nr:hypothetical protein [Polyangiaceae bacterium]